MRFKGKITSWNAERGFGFITPNNGGKKIFLHIKDFKIRRRLPEINHSVTYALSTDKKGRTCAVKAILAGDRLSQKKGSLSVIIAAFFFIIVGIFVFAARIPFLILVLYIIVSLLTFIMYALDKSAAQKGAWRTQESTLHLLALAGGWPGALIAQQKLCHKSRKKPFRLIFWVTVLLNCGAFIWLLTPFGAAALRSLTVIVRGLKNGLI